MKKLVYSFAVVLLAVLTSCASKMGELSPEYFTVTPQVLEAVGGKVPATINGKFPENYFNKKAIVEVTHVLRWQGGEAKGQTATFQGEKVEANNQTIYYKTGGNYTLRTSFDYRPEMAKSELFLDFVVRIGNKVPPTGIRRSSRALPSIRASHNCRRPMCRSRRRNSRMAV